MAARNYIELIEKSMKVLEALSNGESSRSLKDIAAETGLVKSSAFRILYTFKELGYVEQNADNGTYGLNVKILGLARGAMTKGTLRNVARPFMEQVRDELGESVWLAERHENLVHLVDEAEGTHPLRLRFSIGDISALHATALGKVIAAYMEEDERKTAIANDPMKQFTSRTIMDITELGRHLAQVREQGYAVNNEETIEGSIVVAAPVFDSRDRIFSAVAISVPTARWTTENHDLLVQSAIDCGRAITDSFRDIGFVSK